MKKLLILLLLPMSMFAQSNRIIFKESKQVFDVVDKLLSTTKNSYKLVEMDSVECKTCISFLYKDTAAHKLTAYFRKDKDGGNYDLGIPDTLEYRFASIVGFYLDIFPFWKNQFQPDADLTKVQADGHGNIVFVDEANQRFIVTINKDGNAWVIRVNKNYAKK